jgi:hypothetical protein
LGRRK